LKRRADDPPRRPLRLLERPEEISVMALLPEGQPMRFRWRQCLHEVARAEGPERIAMEWWRNVRASGSDQNKSPGPARDYFRVETDAGQRFWLYRDGFNTTRWYLQGIFA
jgi:protein ImuB